MRHLPEEMRACIEACLKCYATCLSMASGHCLEVGGTHAEPAHLRLMLACAELCRTSAHMMLLGTPQHRRTCRECAALCRDCAADCERLGGMEDCVAACRACAEQCEAMAG